MAASLALPESSLDALAVYSEPLVTGRRVVILGDATLGLAERLAELGARAVHVFDADEPRVAAASQTVAKGVSVALLPSGDFDVRDGAFDVAFVPDLAELRETKAVLARLRRLLGNHGVAIIVAKNAAHAPPHTHGANGSFDYYELYDQVSLQFETVRMVGALPFTGLALAELGLSGDVAVSVDTQLARESSPVAFVVVASQRVVELEPYSIVELPFTAPVAPPPALPISPSPDEIAAAQASIADAEAHAVAVAVDREQARARSVAIAAADERAAADEQRAIQIANLEAQLRDAEKRAGDNHVRAERFTLDIKQLEQELEKQRERAFRLTRDVENEKKGRQKAELELGMAKNNPELSETRAKANELEQLANEFRAKSMMQSARIAELETAIRSFDERLLLASAEVEAARTLSEHAIAEEQAQCDALRQALDETRVRVALLTDELARASDHGDVEYLESALRQSGAQSRELLVELRRRETLVHDLLAELDELRHTVHAAHAQPVAPVSVGAVVAHVSPASPASPASPSPTADQSKHLADLARQVAEREAQLYERAFRIQELELQLARMARVDVPIASVAPVAPVAEAAAPAAAGAAAGSPAQNESKPAAVSASAEELSHALDELDILKRALAQEHAAKQRVMSGEELEHARAEIQRQAVLIEQLSRELGERSSPA